MNRNQFRRLASSSPSWTPALLGDVVWFSAGDQFFSDTAGTTPAALGGSIGRRNSTTGNANMQFSSGSEPTLVAAPGGGYGLRFASGKSGATNSLLSSANNTSLTIAAVTTPSSNGNPIVWASQNGLNYYGARGGYAKSNFTAWNLGSAQLINTDGIYDSISDKTAIEVHRYNGVQMENRLNGISKTLAKTASIGLSGALTIGNFYGGGYQFVGDIFDMVVGKSISDTDCQLLESYWRAKYSTPVLGYNRKTVIVDGNSNAITGVTYTPNPWAALLASYLSGSSDCVSLNCAISGQTTAQMITDAATQIDAVYVPNGKKNILIALECENDLFLGASAATAISNFKSYCAARRSAGFYVIAFACPPRSSVGTPVDYESRRVTVNADLENPAHVGVYWDAFLPIHNDSRIGTEVASQGSTYFADHVHYNDAGSNVIFNEYVLPSLLAVL